MGGALSAQPLCARERVQPAAGPANPETPFGHVRHVLRRTRIGTGPTREAQVRHRFEDTAEDDNADEYPKERFWWSPSSLLTSGASAITAFTLAVAGMLGFVGYPVAEALVGLPDGPDGIQERAMVGAIVATVALALFFGTFPLSHRVLVDDSDTVPAWPRHLAGSAAVLAAIGTVLSTITIFGSLLADAP